MSNSPRSRERRRLLRQLLREITSGDFLNGDHMERYNDILAANTPFRMASVFLIGALETVEPVTTPHLQILPWENQDDVDQVGHWIVAYHDGTTLFVYDSAKSTAGSISSEQLVFLCQLFPKLDNLTPTFGAVMKQPNGIDCGLFALANATAIALGQDPTEQHYDHHLMRPHFANMLLTGELTLFPTLPTLSSVHATSPPLGMVSPLPSPSTPYTLNPDDFPSLPPPRKPCTVNPLKRPAPCRLSNLPNEPQVVVENKINHLHTPTSIPSQRIGRPCNKPRGRPKKSLLSRNEQHRDAVKRHSKSHPETNRKAVQKYTITHPETHRKAVQKYTITHPETNRKAVQNAIGVSGGFQNYKTGISFVKILGRTYHRVFDLSWQGSTNNVGMYIDDGTERMRLTAGRSLDLDITRQIEAYLDEVNPFIPVLRRLSTEASEHAHIVFQQTTRRTHGPVLGDVPCANEIAAIINTDAATYSPREVVIWKIGDQKPHTVSMFNPSYECLQYPLLFPHGSEGWHIGKLDNTGRKISQVKYYSHLLLSEPRFTTTRRLGQEYFVDMYCRTEEERLKFIVNNQSSVLRIATRQEIDETIAGEGGAQIGRVYLPSSFTNSSRYMQVKYQDGMAIVHRLGKPTFFLTVTCNPKWEEITKSLNKGEHANDRPDLCDRVFQLKLNFLINELKSGSVFGTVIYILHVIEFQKRGLPHAHICFKVNHGPNEDKDVDRFIRACIPQEERLRRLVLEHMVHGPECTKRGNLPCVDAKTKSCTKKYPKTEVDKTHVDDRGFVQYKRSAANTATIKRANKKYVISDLDIVPYNPALLLQMECHINLELASTRKIVKYLFKYIHKGPDSVRVNIVSDRQDIVNEVEDYVTRRYIGTSDAMWRLFEFDITGRYPTVMQLPVHLPNRDHVVYRPGDEAQALEHTKSKLLLYLERPQTDELLRLTYCQFYEAHMMDTKEKSPNNCYKIDKYFFTPRKRGQVVARLYWVSPALGELFYLRMLLQRFAASSFDDLKSVEGVIYGTFQEAARAHGLLNEEHEFFEALQDASLFMTGINLRRFFYVLISNGAPAVTLWDRQKDILCEDLLVDFPGDPERAYREGLRDIDRVLRNHGSSLEDMGLPSVPDDTTEVGREMEHWNVQTCSSFVEQWMPNLSDEQRLVFEHVKDVWRNNLPQKVMFVDGAGGTGKTLLLNTITAYFRSQNQIVLATATTGVAALLHEGGVTAHSKFKLPLDTDNALAFWSVAGNSQRAELIRQATLFIWDEAPMAHKTTIGVLDRSLRNLMQTNEQFGGKIVLFSGDFRQIPPVVPSGVPKDAIASSLRKSSHWENMATFKLTTLHRSRNDISFSEFVLSVGDGTIETVVVGEDHVVPLRGLTFVHEMTQLIDFVFPADLLSNPDECCSRAILSGTNANIREINQSILSFLPGEATELLSADTCAVESTDDEVIHTELLNTISQPRVPDHRLVLKPGAVCILMRNLCFDEKLVNGSKLIITQISKFCVSARRPNSDVTIAIPRITFKFTVGERGMEMIRRQFPLQLAYGLTINKSQGQTLNVVGVDLRNDVFAHGQLYVALSRVRSSENIRVLVPTERVLDGVAHCVNVVYKELVGN